MTTIASRRFHLELWLVAIFLIMFGLFANSILLLALFFLASSSFIISKWLILWEHSIWDKIDIRFPGRAIWIWNIIFAILGIVIAIWYRGSINIAPFPQSFYWFAVLSIGVGVLEELIFRGVLQSKAYHYGIIFGILFSSLIHTIYKVAIFYSSTDADIWFLAIATYLFGLFLGAARYLIGSLWPLIIFHAFFDLFTYGDRLEAPWWFW